MKNLPFYLLVFLLTFTSNSCYKNDHDNYNAYSISDETPIQNTLTPEDEEEAFRQQIIESMGQIFELFNPLFREIITNPGIFLLTDNSAVVRTGCPCATVTDTNGGFPKTLTLTFDDGSGSCTNTTGSTTKEYSGTLEFVFASALNDGDLTLSQVNSFTVDDYSFISNQDWTWDIEGSGGGSNPAAGMDTNTSLAEQADITVTNTASGATTKWWFSAIPIGQIDIDWSPQITGSDPAEFLNNFRFDITKSSPSSQGVPIHCTNAAGTTTQLGAGFIDLQVTPNSCGCFLNGDLYLTTNPVTFEANPTSPVTLSGNRTLYEWEYECDGSVDNSFTQCDPCYKSGGAIGTSSACQ